MNNNNNNSTENNNTVVDIDTGSMELIIDHHPENEDDLTLDVMDHDVNFTMGNEIDVDDDNDDVDDDDVEDEDEDEDDENENENEDAIINTTTSNDSTVPVGITIAYKRRSIDDETMVRRRQQHRSSSSPITTTATSSITVTSNSRRYLKRQKKKKRNNSRYNLKQYQSDEIPTTTTQKNTTTKTKKRKNKSLQVLYESSIIYVLCILISPPVLTYMYRTYNNYWDNNDTSSTNTLLQQQEQQQHQLEQEHHQQEVLLDEQESLYTGGKSFPINDLYTLSSYYYNSFFDYMKEYESYQYMKSTMYEPTIDYICSSSTISNSNSDSDNEYYSDTSIQFMSSPSTSSSSSYNYYTSYIMTSILDYTGLCSSTYRQQHQQKQQRPILSQDMKHPYMDLFYVFICSLCLATIRFIIVHYTIFLNNNNNIISIDSNENKTDTIHSTNATNIDVDNHHHHHHRPRSMDTDTFTILIRCKSNHLLSSDYNKQNSSSLSNMVVVASSSQQQSNTVHHVNDNNNTNSNNNNDPIISPLPNTDHYFDTKPVDVDVDDDDQNSEHNNSNASFGYHIDVSEHESTIHRNPETSYVHIGAMTTSDSGSITARSLAIGIPTQIATDLSVQRQTQEQNNSTTHNTEQESINSNCSSSVIVVDDYSEYENLLQRQQEQQQQLVGEATTDMNENTPRDISYNNQQHQVDTTNYEKLNVTSALQKQQQQQQQMGANVSQPRYATAIFRLLYCTITAGIALIYFSNANFWPWYVFGTGSTKQCWNLSGGLVVTGLDSDFDQHNVVLKKYFLWQASYHIHSTTFHFVLSMILLFYPFVSTTTSSSPTITTTTTTTPSSSPSNRRLYNIKRGSYAYVRSFIQHILSVVLIGVAYIFSSLRRLGAIGLFAFDISSGSLHLLQICMNAPDDSYLWSIVGLRRRRRQQQQHQDKHNNYDTKEFHRQKIIFIQYIYWCIVIPTFIIARFMIWPTIWYSATYESTYWIQQLEMTLWPGSAFLLRCIMHTLMIILHLLSILYLYRLILSYQLISKL